MYIRCLLYTSSWKDRPTFEELAVMFEGSTASGAERAYRKAVLNNLSFEYYGIQRIERETSILKRQLVTTGKLRQIPVSYTHL